LRLLDNPHQDIPLAAVLRSPLVGMDENDLATIRLLDQQHDFWTAVQLSDDQRVVTFKAWYTKWHRIAQQQDLSTLIGDILETTHWLDYVGAMSGGAQRQANLQALSAYARQFEQQKQSGLFSFIAYIEQLQKADKDLGEASQEAPSQAVRIMTIHGSKGLEFPIVFLPEIDKAFNLMDLNNPVLMHKSAGVAFDVLLSDDQTQAPTLQKMVVKDALKQQAWAEEMRLFYVALTRAEQQLHLFGTVKASQQGHLDVLADRAHSTHGQFLSLADRLLAKSYLEWLYLTLPGVNERPPRVFGPQTPTHADYQVRKIAKQDVQRFVGQSTVPVSEDTVDESVVAHARARLAFTYHNDIATRTAAYQAVSEMKRLFEDPDRLQMATVDAEQTQALWQAELPLPAFMAEDEQRPSSAMLGTATHLILQNWSFDKRADEAAIETLIAQLVTEDLLHESIANLVNRTTILRFLQSPFAQEIAVHVQTLQREAPFSLLMPAHLVYEDVTDEAPILVHGIIDGYFVDDVAKTVTLFDYKTDFVHQDRLQTALPQLQARYAGQLRLYHMALQQQYPTYQVLPPRLIALSANQVLEVPVEQDVR
jgi:ATP-dependent helicase/nuclease subunit A